MTDTKKAALSDTIYTPAELAELWGVTTDTIRKEISKGKLKAFSVGKLKRVLSTEVSNYEGS